jgi:hypothetical protein
MEIRKTGKLRTNYGKIKNRKKKKEIGENVSSNYVYDRILSFL